MKVGVYILFDREADSVVFSTGDPVKAVDEFAKLKDAGRNVKVISENIDVEADMPSNMPHECRDYTYGWNATTTGEFRW